MKLITKPSPIRGAVVSPPPAFHGATPPPVFVDPDRLHEAVRQLMRTRTTMIEACDKADAAAHAAGTPIRTQSFRAHIDAVTTEIRLLESNIAEAAAGERAERQSTVSNVTKTLAQQSTDTLGTVTVGQTSAHLRIVGHLVGSTHSSDRYLPVDHLDDRDDLDRNGISPFLATDKHLAAPKTRVLSESTLYRTSCLADAVRKLLKDGRFGTDRLTHGELKQIVELFKSADSLWLGRCITDLSDSELKLIADDMDSSGFANYDGLSSTEKEAFIANLATKLDATQFARICVAFDDPIQIANVLALSKNCWTAKQGFLVYCLNAFDTRNRKSNFSAADIELTAAAQVMVSLSTPQLGAVLSQRADSLKFLRGVFRLAHGQLLIPSNGRLDCTYDPKLLLAINQLALGLPARSPERFLVFQLTIESLVTMTAAQPIEALASLELLLKANELLGPLPLNVLAAHKADSFLFTDFFVLLARSGQMAIGKSMVESLKGSISQNDAMMVGYVIALIENAEEAITSEREQRIKLAYGFAFALINAFEPWVVVAGSASFSLLDFVTSKIDKGLSVSASIFAAMVKRFNDMGNLLVWLTAGRDLAENRSR